MPSINPTSNFKTLQAGPVCSPLKLEIIFVSLLENVALDLPYRVVNVHRTWMIVCERGRQTSRECLLDDVEHGVDIQDGACFREDGLARPEEL